MGPRYQVYVVAARDLAVFTLGRLPDAGRIRHRAEDLADRLHVLLGDARMRYDDAGQALGVHGNTLRYAALTGRLAIRWEGARLPTVWTVPPPEIAPAEATLELARRYLHVFGPARAEAFGKWAGIGTPKAARVFDGLGAELIQVLTPPGEAFMLARDEPAIREAPAPAAAARLLPSGDAYTLRATSEDRALLVPDAGRRRELWTPRVWPGALLVAGEIAGTWRRAQRTVTIQAWQRLSRAAREAVLAEAESLRCPTPAGGSSSTGPEHAPLRCTLAWRVRMDANLVGAVAERFYAVNGRHPMTGDDDSYASAWYVALEDLAGASSLDADEIRRLMLANRLPLPSYIRSDGAQMVARDLLELLGDAGGVDRVLEWFAAQWDSPEEAIGQWDAYLSGQYVCLRQVRPETMRRKDELVQAITDELASPQPESADWLARTHELVDELDALEPPFAPYDRLRFGGPVSRDRLIDEVREHYPRATATVSARTVRSAAATSRARTPAARRC